MLGKILLTLLVTIGAVLVLKHRNQQAQSAEKQGAAGKTDTRNDSPDQGMSDIRTGAYLFLIIMFGVAATLYYFRWQDDHSIVTVKLIRGDETAPVQYQVYKFQLQERSFTTIDGTQITVADSERMEVAGLE